MLQERMEQLITHCTPKPVTNPNSDLTHMETTSTTTYESGGAVALFGGVIGLVIAALVFVFWLWMLIDCLTKETDSTQKIVWALIIFFLPCLGSLIYLFVRKIPRGKVSNTPPRL